MWRLQVDDLADPKYVTLEITNNLVQCNIKGSDIRKCYRKTTKKGSIIIAKFINSDIKHRVLQKRKSKKWIAVC